MFLELTRAYEYCGYANLKLSLALDSIMVLSELPDGGCEVITFDGNVFPEVKESYESIKQAIKGVSEDE